MELCKGGELSDELRRKTYFREEVCMSFVTVQIAPTVYCSRTGNQSDHGKAHRGRGLYA